MGHEFGGSKEIVVEDLSFGWFPGRALEDIPGSFNGNKLTGLGASEADGFIWHNGRLRKPFQHEAITTSALAGDPDSLFWWLDQSTLVGTAGSTAYSGLQNAAPTDITGGYALTADPMSWVAWKFETDNYVILTNGFIPPARWTGAGSISALNTVNFPPRGRYAAVFQDAAWFANCRTAPLSNTLVDLSSTVFFSALADPLTWAADQGYTFEAPITGIGVLDKILVVFKRDSIGILYGTNNFQLIKIDSYISGIGCTSHRSIRNIKLEGKDALLFHSNRGWAAFTGTKEIIYLSAPIEVKYQGNESIDKFNATEFDSVVSTWWGDHSWAVSAIADAGSTSNNLLVVKDCRRVFSLPGIGTEIGVAHWPFFLGATQDTLTASCMETIQVGGRDVVVFGQTGDDKIYKLNEEATTYQYVPYFTTKVVDLGAYYICNEANIVSDPLAPAQLYLYINMSLDASRGEVGLTPLTGAGDLLSSTFVLDTSILSGNQYAYNNIQVSDFGRWMQLTFQQYPSSGADAFISFYKAHLTLTPIGNDPTAVDSSA